MSLSLQTCALAYTHCSASDSTFLARPRARHRSETQQQQQSIGLCSCNGATIIASWPVLSLSGARRTWEIAWRKPVRTNWDQGVSRAGHSHVALLTPDCVLIDLPEHTGDQPASGKPSSMTLRVSDEAGSVPLPHVVIVLSLQYNRESTITVVKMQRRW